MKISLLTVLLLFLFVNAYTQSVTIEVKDKLNGTAIENAYVTLEPGNHNNTTDSYGLVVFSHLPDGQYLLGISRVGYKAFTTSIIINNDSRRLIFSLDENLISTGEIKVYSGRIEQQLKYAVLPIILETRESIELKPGISVSDVVKYRAGVNLLRDGVWGNDIIIRGLARDNIITLIDGNRIETANNHSARLSLIDLNSIERIEIIKGGTSSLYGSGAIGGIVSITTNRETFTSSQLFSGSLSGNYSTVNEMSAGTLNLQYATERLFFNLSGTLREASDTKTPGGVIRNSAFRDNNISLHSGLKFSEKFNVTSNIQRSYSPFAGIPGGNLLFPTPADVTYKLAKREMIDLSFNFNALSNTFTKLKAKFYLQNIIRDVNIIPNTVVVMPASGNNPARRISNLLLTPSGEHYTKGLNIDTDFLLSSKTRGNAGIDLWMRDLKTSRERTQKIEVLDSNNNVIITNIVQTGDVPIPESRFINAGAYIQNETSLMNDKFYMQYGGRIDFIFVSNEQSLNPLYVITNGVVNNNPSNQVVLWQSGSENDISWSLNTGFNYRLTNTVNLNANFSASFRSPSLEERYQYIDLGNLVRLGNPSLKPELGFFTTAGVKMWGDKLNLSFELFSNFLQDQVVEVPGTFENRPALIKENIGKSRLYGFDFEAEYSVLNNLAVYGNVGYVIGENTEKDTPLPQIPPLNGVFGLRYELNGIGKIDANAVVFATQDRVSTGEATTGGYTVYNLFVNFNQLRFDRYSIGFSAGVENIFDRKYRDHISTTRGSITTEPGVNFFFKSSLGF